MKNLLVSSYELIIVFSFVVIIIKIPLILKESREGKSHGGQ